MTTRDESASRPPHLGSLLAFRFIGADEHEAVVEADPLQEHSNIHGNVHGGYIAALMDTATGWTVHHSLPEGTSAVHVQLNIQYVRAAVLGEPLVCRATTLSAGRRIAASEAVVTQGGRLIAKASGTHSVVVQG